MQTKSTAALALFLFIYLLIPINSIAQRNPPNRGGDDRIKDRLQDKKETIVRERPNQTKIPEVKNPPPNNNHNKPPEYHHPKPPHYHPVPPICYDPSPQRPNPHLPKNPEVLITNYKLNGIEKLEEGDNETALEYLTQAIWLDSNDYELYYYKGISEIKLQLYEEALEDLDYFLEYIIYEPDGYFQRGLAKFYLNKKAEAKEDFLIAAEMEHKLAISILKRYY